uniref:RING-type E3 ubiquitin transferase n=1 Tax=Lates calcarifer TaxID=8187 RepID=A0A4W6EGK7_LATCA
MGGKQSTAGRPRGAFPGVSTDDSAVPPSAHFGHYRPSGTMGLRSRSVSSVAGMGIDHSPAVPFGFYTPRGTDSDRAGGGSGGTTAAPHGTGYQDTGGGGHHTDGVLYLGSRGSLADALPLHIAPRWFSAHSGKGGLLCKMSDSILHHQLVNATLQGVLRLDCPRCTVCIGHSLLCEMTVISLLPNLAESIRLAIREE